VYPDLVHIVVHPSDGTSRTVRRGALTTVLLPGFKLRLDALEVLIEKP
jgi:hypothetical protein